MNEEYTYVKTNDVQKDMHDFVNQFGDEINSVSYVGNTIKLKNEVVYRFTYNTIGIRKYYTYTEIYNHHLKFQSEKSQKENKILKENAENNDKVVDKVNWENQLLKKENQQLKQELQQKEDIINKITNYCKFQIEKEQDKFPKPLESEKWLKGRISAFEEILDNKGE